MAYRGLRKRGLTVQYSTTLVIINVIVIYFSLIILNMVFAVYSLFVFNG